MAEEIGEMMLSDFDLEGKNKAQKAAYYLRHYGAAYTVKKALRKLGVPISAESEYMTWCRRHMASKAELRRQREDALSKELSFAIVGEPGADLEGSGWKGQTARRVALVPGAPGQTVSEILNKTDADFYVFSGKGVTVYPEFLYEAAGAALLRDAPRLSKVCERQEGLPDLIYTDEDNAAGKRRMRPFFKPDASRQLLLNFPYLGRCFAVKKCLLVELSNRCGQLQLFGNGWHELSLFAFRWAKHIYHIPKPLFSNQVAKEEGAAFVRGGAEGAGCLKRFLASEGREGTVVSSDVPGFFHVEGEKKESPLVSVIIPNKDHAADLKVCLDSLRELGGYPNYEVIVAENNSEESGTFDYYEKLQKEDGRVHVVTYEGGFNYSKINNFAVKSAKGELLLFLNNDTKVMEEGALRQLVSSVLKPGVGACGAMLYYEDGTIQHAGVILGMGGFAAHALWSLTDRDEAYYPFSLCEREVSAVTGACLMARRTAFEEAGGMDETFAVALNDVDFCMKIRALGYAILFNPYAKLYHFESKSRGYEDTMEKQARFQDEIARFQAKWEQEIVAGDPYYNPNLTLHRADYSMDEMG